MAGLIKKIFANDNFLATVGNMFAAGLGFLSFILLTRILSLEDFGIWVLYLTAFTFLDMLRAGVIHTALVRFANNGKPHEVYGSAWVISLSVTVVLGLLVYVLGLFEFKWIEQASLTMFFKWYPLLSLASLPFNVALWVQQAENKFNRILFIRLMINVPFVAVLGVGMFYAWDLETVILGHLGCNLLSSLFAMVNGWAGLRYIGKATRDTIRELLHFGKFSMGTLIGTNLLKVRTPLSLVGC